MKAWPIVALGEVLRQSDDPVTVVGNQAYPIAGVYGFGRGLFARESILGNQTSYTQLNRLHAGAFIISRVKAWEGAVGVVPPELDGYFVSKEFPSFIADAGRADVRWLKYFFGSEYGRQALVGCTKGIGARRERVKEAAFLKIALSLPPLAEQQAVVARLEALAEKTRQVEAHLNAAERDAEHLLAVRFREAIADSPMLPLAVVAPAVRRPVALDLTTSYREVGARSFGKGLFAKPNFEGSEATWEKPVWVKAGDLVLSNIKAWEGAIAVAGNEHDGCIASHRYITCVPDSARVTVGFLAYYLLSEDGLEKVGAASPGTADRNRTLSLDSLGKIEVPVAPLATQRAFDRLQTKVAALKAKHAAIRAANAALLPATLERIFRA